MWQNQATQDNVALLERRGVHVLPVESGELACGDDGAGRMLSIEAIAERVAALTGPRLLAGKRVLISSGPTAEPVDSVRVITNRSSGKMGAALARAALALGAQVTVVTGPAPVAPPAGARTVQVNTAEQMRAALIAEYRDADACILAAAVADFTVKNPSAGKIDRRASGEVTITLVPTPDIAAELGRLKKRQLLVGFALEHGDGLQRAREKMRAKNCDLMVLNHPETALETDTTLVTLLSRAGKLVRLKAMTKDETAAEIMQRVAARMGVRR
jgi:phosphopantothenoylcysteine decarboxylase/phosphopantothenate--cysteine ligase